MENREREIRTISENREERQDIQKTNTLDNEKELTVGLTTSELQTPYPGFRDFVRQAFLRRNIPEAGIPILLSSICEKTLKQYDSVFKKWWSYCSAENFNPFNYDLKISINLLKTLVDEGLSYSSINMHKSALSLVIRFPSKEDYIFKRFLKGIYNMTPPMPKYLTTWDPSLVLRYLEGLYSHENISLEKLVHKLVTLLASTSAHRIQTISLIKIENIIIKSTVLEIKISDRIKTSGRDKNQPILRFPFFREKPPLCVASLISHYLERTNLLRPKNEERLIITTKKPFRAASTQTLSRWIKNVLSLSGIDCNIFKGYSTRHAATSAAARDGLSVDAIRKTAG
ncbi:uncharacterized protein [Leptinotarsa decemlineata]|uniref:uncharacterized protein n=1 Tax=Leptinotarsa decemlineata TaxID=7539 RepID=UPI003D30CEEC